jgi:hypothetical protein
VSIENELIEAYQNAEYVLFSNPEVIMHIGEYNPDLHELMTARQCQQAAFISAYNPYSEIIEDSENVKRHGDLLDAVNGLGLDTVLGEGRDVERQWLGEISLLIFDIDRITADALGNEYGQNAILWIEADAIPQLVLLDGKEKA